MAYNVIVRDEAFEEALKAYLYYEDKQDGLGEQFLTALQGMYEHLKTNPNYYSILASDKKRVLRDVKLKGFPYLLIFSISGSDVFVYAIHNTYKNLPRKYRRKQ